MGKRIYTPASFFLLRIPIWPIDKFKNLSSEKLESLINVYFANQQLREAIAIASPTLYKAFKKNTSKSLKSESKSLSHYISRMMTRPTPFGFFSCVSTAQWGESTTIYFDEQLINKRARFDMEWVYLFIQHIYQDKKKFPLLPVRTNPLLELSGERYYLNYLRDAEKGLTSVSTSIRATGLIQRILDYAKVCTGVNQLWLKLHESLPILQEDKTIAVLHQLFSQQFLLPGITPSLLSPSPFDCLLPHLSLFPDMSRIFEQIESYNAIPPGKGEEALENLQENMAALLQNKAYLQVDTTYEKRNLKLSNNILGELEKVVHLLWKISCLQKQSTTLSTYHSKFIEKYGVQRTVPLLEMLDANRGLGPMFENPPSTSSESNQWEKLLHQQWQECLFNKKKEWVLTEEIFDQFLPPKESLPGPLDAPLSLDILCKIFAASIENIDLGEFVIVLSDIIHEGGSSFGRFIDILGEDIKGKMAEFFASEEQLEPHSIFTELSYLPSKIRSANVAMHPCLRNYRLDIEVDQRENSSLALDDIYVGATSSRFYLTDKEGKYNIITRTNNLFSMFYAPPPLKFMRCVNLSQYHSISLFNWGPIQDLAVFLPRVRFGKTILSLAKWNINPRPYIKGSLDKNMSSFNAWADQWELPQRFCMVHADQHLLLDRNNPNDMYEIIRKLKKGDSLTFIEKIEGAWIKGSEGSHYCEISVPFVKNNEYARKENPFKIVPYSSYSSEERDKFPGSNWLYFKLYIGDEKINEFVVTHLYNFMEDLRKKEAIHEWFFIRYHDPEPHLRLRMHFHSTEMISNILSEFENKFRTWINLGWVKDLSVAKYEREIERYGGSELIEAAETTFFHDTITTLCIINALSTKQIQCEEVVLYAVSVVNFLGHFGLDEKEALSILDRSAADQSELAGFRNHKNELISLISALQQGGDSQIPEIQLMRAASQISRECIQNYYQLSGHLERERRNSIIDSLLHMHCNRLGCLGKIEVKARLYARQTLLAIVNKNAMLHKVEL
ncbi:MAG: lantibiotic dehydratase [Candidatus Protochlamydia sp.]|nr:lantibiotic dehydratase [Candidatus Protochlamydia sp.]